MVRKRRGVASSLADILPLARPSPIVFSCCEMPTSSQGSGREQTERERPVAVGDEDKGCDARARVAWADDVNARARALSLFSGCTLEMDGF